MYFDRLTKIMFFEYFFCELKVWLYVTKKNLKILILAVWSICVKNQNVEYQKKNRGSIIYYKNSLLL